MKRNILFRITGVVGLFFAPILYLLTTTTLSAEKSATSDVGAFEGVTRSLTAYLDPLVNLIYIIGAVVGLIGTIEVYQKFSQGDPDTGKTTASWSGACIFLAISASVLKAFFISWYDLRSQ